MHDHMSLDIRLIGNWEEGVGIGRQKPSVVPSGIPLEELNEFASDAKEYFENGKKHAYRGTIDLGEKGIKEIAAFLSVSKSKILVVIDDRDDDPMSVSQKMGI